MSEPMRLFTHADVRTSHTVITLFKGKYIHFMRPVGQSAEVLHAGKRLTGKSCVQPVI